MSANITIGGELAFPSKYVGAADLKGRDVTLTISKVNFDMLMLQGGKKQKKVVIWFEKTDKMMVCNKTNALTIAGMYGPKMELWAGKRITLFPTTTRCGPKTVDCIRVREDAPPVPHPSAENFTIDPSTSNEAPDPDVSGADAEPPADAATPIPSWEAFYAQAEALAQEVEVPAAQFNAAMAAIKLNVTDITKPGTKGGRLRAQVWAEMRDGQFNWADGKVMA